MVELEENCDMEIGDEAVLIGKSGNEEISVEYIQDEEDTLLKALMREKLNSDEFLNFEKLLNETGNTAFVEEMEFLADRNSMNEHLWEECK